ncbi:MAG: hypothetical protein IE927_03460 [Rhodobacterales bacterium]|nr:hypothetical protein [Rhodobacterales bacterium]
MLLRSLKTAFLALVFTAGAAAAELRLVMFEQAGCVYCERWKAEVGDAYRVTAEGRAAPLMPMDIRDPVPTDISLQRRPVYTPTFVLLQDGVEIGRIEGYPGEDFFWGLLGQMLTGAGVDLSGS